MHQATLSPNTSKERPRSAVKSASVDTSDNQELIYHQRQQKKQKNQQMSAHQQHLHQNLYIQHHQQQLHHSSRSKEPKSNTTWYQDDTIRSSSVDVHSMSKLYCYYYQKIYFFAQFFYS